MFFKTLNIKRLLFITTLSFIYLGSFALAQQNNSSNISYSSSKIKFKNGNSLSGFHLRSIRGDLFFRGDYRFQSNQLKTGFREDQKSGAFSGEINLFTNSYILHPNFILIDFNLGYAPGIQNDNFLVAPDRTDSRSAEKVDFALTFFNRRPISLKTFANYNHGFINRELTTDVESYQFNAGANLFLRNQFLPVTISYIYNNWIQDELQSLRRFDSKRSNFSVQISKDVSNWNKNEFEAYYEDYFRSYVNTFVNNKTTSVKLTNKFFFNSIDDQDDKNKVFNKANDRYTSRIWYYNQVGSQPIKRFIINQDLLIKSRSNIEVDARYQYSDFKYLVTTSKQHFAFGQLSYKLYRSLKSFINFEYNKNDQFAFNHNRKQFAIGFKYRKEIPTGTFRLSYQYRVRAEDRITQEGKRLFVVDEEHQLTDGEIELLVYPGVKLETVNVTDFTQSIIYQVDLDYFLIQRGEFIEIARVPGGLIPNGETVYVDYETEFKADFNYRATGNNFTIGVSFMYSMFDVYFSYNDFNYDFINGFVFNTFKFFNQRVFGAKANIALFTAGFEYDDYNSNITPYESLRYYVEINQMISDKLLISLTGNYRDYFLIHDLERQLYKYVIGRLKYFITPRNRFELFINARVQDGRGIDLDLTSFRAEFESRIRLMIVTIGYENFYRNFSGEKVNYNNIYLRIGRRF